MLYSSNPVHSRYRIIVFARLACLIVALAAFAGAAEAANSDEETRYTSARAYFYALRAELHLQRGAQADARRDFRLARIFDPDSSLLVGRARAMRPVRASRPLLRSEVGPVQ